MNFKKFLAEEMADPRFQRDYERGMEEERARLEVINGMEKRCNCLRAECYLCNLDRVDAQGLAAPTT